MLIRSFDLTGAGLVEQSVAFTGQFFLIVEFKYFRALKEIGISELKHKTRIATINHEWVYLILPNENRYERVRFNYYCNKYSGLLTNNEITMIAKVEADAYAVTYRDNLIASSKKSLVVFN